ncbi:DUF4184 family protein [Paenalkalicoccus suaedae]|uniref:DUF4184 family protein n=1 Tax=Paenalkalicoccus suaedae TaxID=2592382 RepID=A0A859FCA0_9BACI|nr:DUF4184 family protein [Paenalkalicoccus suaedae]QKS69895.1 DUF4184 family protein [Paenalkalicoccus suaedae]
MPLTLAHPAAVLPFSRNSKYIDFTALVLGSMAPDFEYFLRGQPAGVIGHTWTGFFVLNLPMVIILYILYKTFIHKTLFQHLPTFLQDTYSQKIEPKGLLKIVVLLYSALLGMLTHVTWDSFTHQEGFMVLQLSFLRNSVHVFDYTIPIYSLLQHGSTLLGLTVIVAYMMFRTAKYSSHRRANAPTRQKLVYWSQIAGLSVLLVGFWYAIDPVPLAAIGAYVVRIIDVVAISLLVVSVYFVYGRRRYKKIFLFK